MSRRKAPPLNAPKLTLRPDGRPSYERQGVDKEHLTGLHEFHHGDPANAEVYDPRESQRISKPGEWVMIVRQLPPIEGEIDAHVRVGRLFFVEHKSNADDFGFLPDGSYKVLCRSPWGDVQLWPYEYAKMPIPTMLSLWQEGELLFHPTNMELGRLNEVVFYARSRGIPLADALVMALGTIQGPVGWFEPRADLVPELEAMEERVHRWNPKRRSRMTVKLEGPNHEA